jgi:hypothetical protein
LRIAEIRKWLLLGEPTSSRQSSVIDPFGVLIVSGQAAGKTLCVFADRCPSFLTDDSYTHSGIAIPLRQAASDPHLRLLREPLVGALATDSLHAFVRHSQFATGGALQQPEEEV